MSHLQRRTIVLGLPAAIALPTRSYAAVTIEQIKPGDYYYVIGPTECVFYARRYVPSLPRGLFTMDDKRKIINSNTPKAGRIAIINLGSVGHVAVVVAVDNSGSSRSIKIAEMNVPVGSKYPRYRTATCGSKISDAERQLKIEGYFKG